MFWKMDNLIISPSILEKIKTQHNVTRREVEQCFDNKCGIDLIDAREKNKTTPPTLWFIAKTNREKLLKVVYIYRDGNFHLKTAYPPNAEEINIYECKGKEIGDSNGG